MARLPGLKLSDRITWAVLLWIFVELLWLRFLDAFVPVWAGTILITAAAVAFVLFWPPPAEEAGDEEEAAAGGREEER